jgi:hypothetical protein
MADTETHPNGAIGSRRRINRRLPAGAKVRFHRVCVLCRRYPRVQGRKGHQTIHVKDGVLIPQSDVTFGDRSVDEAYKILDRTIEGNRIDVRPEKVRGSRNHHKFKVVITDGVVS